MPMQMNDPQLLAQIQQAAARLGVSPDAYLRMIQNQMPGMLDAPVMPQQRPFAEGRGPGGGYGAGQGQQENPLQGFGGVGIGSQINPAGGQQDPTDPAYSPEPQATPGIFGQLRDTLSYGGIPFSDRLGNTASILSAFADPHGRSLAPAVANAAERMSQLRDLADRKEAYFAEQAREQKMARSLYNNLKDTNPQAAEAILSNPGLIKDYMKGQFDLENTRVKENLRQSTELAVEGARQEGAMELEKYKTENDPEVLAMKQWQEGWKDFIDANDLGNASTVEVYQTYYDDKDITPNEAKRIASANLQGGQKAMDDMYSKVIDDRTKTQEVTLAKEAASLAGINLKPGQYIENKDEVVASGGKVAPIVKWAEGTEEAMAAEANKAYDWKADSADYLATQRAIDALTLQESGEALTGGGWTGLTEILPETNALELGRALQSVNAGQAFKKLQDIRRANPNGAGVGNVTEGEYPIMTAAENEKFDIRQDPATLKKRLQQHQRIASAYMDLDPTVDPKLATRSLMQYLIDGLRADPTPENQREFDEQFGSGYAALVLKTHGDIPR